MKIIILFIEIRYRYKNVKYALTLFLNVLYVAVVITNLISINIINNNIFATKKIERTNLLQFIIKLKLSPFLIFVYYPLLR